ncbi:MAG: SpoIID/LytB domain-containing protein [Acidobacteriota bacterium]
MSSLLAVLAMALSTTTVSARTPAPLKVGLGIDGERVAIGGAEKVRVSGAEGLSELKGPVTVAVVDIARVRSIPLPAQYSVRVRYETDRARAEAVANALSSKVSTRLRVRATGGGHEVVAGPLGSEEEARELTRRLAEAGMRDAVVRKDSLPPATEKTRLVILDGDLVVHPVFAPEITLSSAGSDLLTVDGGSYRGELIVRRRGESLQVVNRVELEEYLRGVVPEELGPDVFPETEALAAQAVAARTWVLTHRHAHSSDGFEVCATPHCQVYGGASSEKSLSDRAVSITAGRVLVHGGELARTYFSSTCGGHTEAIENVFGGPPIPYLRGVSCLPEAERYRSVSGRAHPADWALVDGRAAHELLARLAAFGIVVKDELRSGGFDGRARADETASWLRRAGKRLGRSFTDDELGRVRLTDAGELVSSLATLLAPERTSALHGPADRDAYARFNVMKDLRPELREAASVGLRMGWLPAGLPPGWADERVSRGHVLEIVASWLEDGGELELERVRFVGIEGRELNILRGRGRTRAKVTLSPDVMLLSGPKTGPWLPREQVELKLGDALHLPVGTTGPLRYLRVEEDVDGAAYDRLSAYSWWTRRLSLDHLDDRARRRVGQRGLRDLRVTRVSPAGRVVGLELIGNGWRKDLEGFAVRQFLGLPDNRAALRFERDASGTFTGLRAVGRGWGHGVGLCQVGAYGLALRGKTHRDILGHYFPGARLADLRTLP